MAAQLILMNGRLGALAVVVQRVGDELLAGAVFALNEDVRVAAGHALDQLEHFVHLLALADDVAEAELPLELLLEQLVLADQVAPLDRALEHRQQRVGFDRLLDEAVRARLHRLDRLGHAAVASDDDDFGRRMDLLELAQQLEPVGVRQHHVGHDDVRLPGPEDLLAASPDHRGPDLVALVLEQDLQPLDHRGLVVNRENAALLLSGHSSELGLQEAAVAVRTYGARHEIYRQKYTPQPQDVELLTSVLCFIQCVLRYASASLAGRSAGRRRSPPLRAS